VFHLTIESQTMTQNQFDALCSEHNIHPSIALENDDLRQALKDRNDQQVIEILTNEF
jgi:hypothetical protein